MVWSTGYEKDESPISSDYVSDAISDFASGGGGDRNNDFRFYDAPSALRTSGVPIGDILDPQMLQKEIRQFQTERPALTRQELLDVSNISPYSREGIVFEQMVNGLVDLPSEGLNAIRMEMIGDPNPLKGTLEGGTGEIPSERKDFITRASEKLADKFDFNDDEERVVMMSGGEVPRSEGTYSVTSENTALDFLGNMINPASSFMRVDTRDVVPMTGGETRQLGMLSTPFGTVTSLTPYSQLGVGDIGGGDGSDPAFIPPRTGAARGTQSLVPMGTDRYGTAGAAAGMTLNPSMYYTNPFSYSLPALSKSFGLLSF